jgi:hypothetical protein
MPEPKHRNVPPPPKKKPASQPKRADNPDIRKRDPAGNRQGTRDPHLQVEEHLGGLWKALGLM